MKLPISYDEKDNCIDISLPADCSKYAEELKEHLYADFAFEGISKDSLSAMNSSAIEWLEGRGITKNWEKDND